MKLGSRKIGPDQPPLIIPEIGIAHGGDLDEALDLQFRCFQAGAEACKTQHHLVDSECTKDHPWYETIKKSQLTLKELSSLREHARYNGKLWLCTPFCVQAVDDLESLDVVAYKVGSGEVSHRPLLERIAETWKPVLMSTGLHTRAEWIAADRVLRDGGCEVAMLQCVSEYPAPLEAVDVNIALRNEESPVGWSDHSGNIAAALAAIAHGAEVVEIHVGGGPDAEASISFKQLRELIRLAPMVWEACRPARPPRDEELRRIARHDRHPDWLRCA